MSRDSTGDKVSVRMSVEPGTMLPSHAAAAQPASRGAGDVTVRAYPGTGSAKGIFDFDNMHLAAVKSFWG